MRNFQYSKAQGVIATSTRSELPSAALRDQTGPYALTKRKGRASSLHGAVPAPPTNKKGAAEATPSNFVFHAAVRLLGKRPLAP